jgi:Uma2 family endonuclease
MTADEFFDWIEGREGRWELIAGELIEKSPETAAHAQTREATASAFKGAIRRSSLDYHVAPDGAVARIAFDAAFEPDLLIYRGDRPHTVEIREPAIVIEVISDATATRDEGVKVEGYFALPSVSHYLVLDPERRAAVCRSRGEGGAIVTRVLTEGPLELDNPGLALFVEECFPPH